MMLGLGRDPGGRIEVRVWHADRRSLGRASAPVTQGSHAASPHLSLPPDRLEQKMGRADACLAPKARFLAAPEQSDDQNELKARKFSLVNPEGDSETNVHLSSYGGGICTIRGAAVSVLGRKNGFWA